MQNAVALPGEEEGNTWWHDKKKGEEDMMIIHDWRRVFLIEFIHSYMNVLPW